MPFITVILHFSVDLQLFVSRLDVFLFSIVSHSGSGSVQLNMRALFSEELLWSLFVVTVWFLFRRLTISWRHHLKLTISYTWKWNCFKNHVTYVYADLPLLLQNNYYIVVQSYSWSLYFKNQRLLEYADNVYWHVY